MDRLMISIKRLLIAAALATAATGAAHAQVANIGHVGLSFYEATANVLVHMLERARWNVTTTSGSHAQIFPKVADGEVDLFVAAWLPHAHAPYWAEHKDKLVRVSALFEDARLYWAVPDYVPADAVRSVADLTRPQVAEKMAKTIRGTLPDSGLMIGSKKIFEHYRLADAGYELVPGPARDWIANFEAHIAAKDWFVMPLWQPQYLNRAHKLRILEEPEQLLGGANTAYLVANAQFWSRLGKQQRDLLSRIELNLKAVTQMDYWVNVEKMSPRDAARRWIASNPMTVDYWIRGLGDEE
jgi:glycine betaine/proline transport system substrate-binding protein